MTGEPTKYDRAAEHWTEESYADPHAYLGRRVWFVTEFGPPLAPGDSVLDLACGDGGLGALLLARGLTYRGVDLSGRMVEAARRRLGERAALAQGDLNTYEPPEPVDATTLFRGIYYADDRAAFFRRAARYTRRKLVFDVNPRRIPLDEVTRELRSAGFARVDARPFFAPQTVALPRPLGALLAAAERTGPLARLALRVRFSYLVAASKA